MQICFYQNFLVSFNILFEIKINQNNKSYLIAISDPYNNFGCILIKYGWNSLKYIIYRDAFPSSENEECFFLLSLLSCSACYQISPWYMLPSD
jgi:hypothetical protein